MMDQWQIQQQQQQQQHENPQKRSRMDDSMTMPWQ